MKRIILLFFVYSLKCVNRNGGFLLPLTMKKMYDLWIIGVCVYNKLCDSFSKTVSEFIINDVIPVMAFYAEIWQQKRLRLPLEVTAFSSYTDDSYLILYREIDMSCCNIVLALRTDQSWLYVTVHVIHYSRYVERQTSSHWLRFYRFIISAYKYTTLKRLCQVLTVITH